VGAFFSISSGSGSGTGVGSGVGSGVDAGVSDGETCTCAIALSEGVACERGKWFAGFKATANTTAAATQQIEINMIRTVFFTTHLRHATQYQYL